MVQGQHSMRNFVKRVTALRRLRTTAIISYLEPLNNQNLQFEVQE